MRKTDDKSIWPEIPESILHSDFRVPWTFRELVSRKDLSNDDIGRITRCLAMDTDFFATPSTEAEILIYRDKLHQRAMTRERVAKIRKRAKDNVTDRAVNNCSVQKKKVLGNDDKTGVSCGESREVDSVTVTLGASDTISKPKTPRIPEEETPPIIPLEKKCPSPLEKSERAGRNRAKSVSKGKMDQFSEDLFSVADSLSDQDIDVSERMECVSLRSERASGAQEGLGEASMQALTPGANVGDSGAVSEDATKCRDTGDKSVDTRNDLAWIPPKFAIFWEQYPRKVAKKDAQKAFTKLIKSQKDVDVFMGVMMDSLAYWKRTRQWKRDSGMYIPYPATWLNAGHWQDSVENGSVPVPSDEKAKFLASDAESDADLIRRMTGSEGGDYGGENGR